MDPRHPSEDEIFEQALDLSGEARSSYLKEAVRGDQSLRQRVEALLRAEEKAGAFMNAPPPAVSAATISITTGMLPLTEKPGDKIGRYKLREQIGEGGCGVVYVAEQEEPVRRRVALKVIKLGMDTRQVVARFEAERQALALMDHPNIAKVLDAGATDTGRPYFVMELVRGIKITDYCDKNNLVTEERLKLFIQVCLAIQHAHQKGIIHRDIKPSNILVTLHDGVPVPKVIDFGIAKATTDQRLTDKTIYTAFEQFIGTPAYMSPEQAEMSGLDIDTRSDIYSLGVLLYELLTGRTPFDAVALLKAGLEQMRKIIREQEPQRPSTRLSTLEAADLTAVASHRRADPPKLLHLIRGDLDWIVMKSLEKDRTRRYETVNGLAADIKRHLENEPVLARSPSRFYQIQKLIRRNSIAIGAACAVTLALACGLVLTTSLLVQERVAHRRALAAESVEAHLREVTKAQRLSKDARDLENQGKLSDAEPVYRELLAIQKKLYGNSSSNFFDSLNNLTYLLQREGKFPEAEAASREAIAAQRSLRNETLSLAMSLHRLGDTLSFERRFAEAEALQREALRIQKQLLDDKELFWTVSSLAWAMGEQGKVAEVKAVQREYMTIYRAEAELGNLSAQKILARMYAQGEGVPKDQNEAAYWYRKAADQGYDRDQIILAGMYASGRGIPKDEGEAARWYRRVVEQRRKDAQSGNATALNGLARLLATCELAQVRDGSNAVHYAERAVSATSRTNALMLDTPAAAYAETDQFEKAVKVQNEAIALLESDWEKSDYITRLTVYESNSPYRELDQ
jgi:serine/threonine protein kinase